jgi:hypothetical protein
MDDFHGVILSLPRRVEMLAELGRTSVVGGRIIVLSQEMQLPAYRLHLRETFNSALSTSYKGHRTIENSRPRSVKTVNVCCEFSPHLIVLRFRTER